MNEQHLISTGAEPAALKSSHALEELFWRTALLHVGGPVNLLVLGQQISAEGFCLNGPLVVASTQSPAPPQFHQLSPVPTTQFLYTWTQAGFSEAPYVDSPPSKQALVPYWGSTGC